ncbi:MAG: hypothetical protein H2174_01085 [Vampirovibrio sp.]|nr:hypothetical protein [Vampirovibrio sp.]
MLFSERNGYLPKIPIQIENFDKESIRHFIDCLEHLNLECCDYEDYSFSKINNKIKEEFVINKRVFNADAFDQFCFFDSRYGGNTSYTLDIGGIHEFILTLSKKGKWFHILDFFEILIQDKLISAIQLNDIFKNIGWGYTATQIGEIVPSTNEFELSSLNEVLTLKDSRWSSVQKAFEKAIITYSTRPNTDFATVINQATVALDILVGILSQKKEYNTVSKWIAGNKKHALTLLTPNEKLEVIVTELEATTQNILTIISKLNGIRGNETAHANKPIDQALTHWYLVNCSAFINLMIQRHTDQSEIEVVQTLTKPVSEAPF